MNEPTTAELIAWLKEQPTGAIGVWDVRRDAMFRAALEAVLRLSTSSNDLARVTGLADARWAEIDRLENELTALKHDIARACVGRDSEMRARIAAESRLNSALERMDRARDILTSDPNTTGNWGVLDTTDLRESVVEKLNINSGETK
jgi:hypothetical protein